MNKYLIPEIMKLQGIESFCYQNCLRIILGLQGIQNPELYLNATLSIRYNIQEKSLSTGEGNRSLLPSEDGHVDRFFYEDNVEPLEVLNENLKYIKDHYTPIVVGADTYFIPYAHNFGKNHARHALILCGADLQNQKVEVIDWYPNWYFKGTMELSDFIKARSSVNESDGTVYSGSSIGNNWAFIDGVKQRSKKDLLLELLSVLKMEYYRESDKEFMYGPQAIQALKDTIIDNCLEQESFKSLHDEIWFIEKRYKFFHGYLEWLGENVLKKELADVKQNIIFESEEWDKMLLLSAKGCIMQSDRVREKMKMRLDKILQCDVLLKESIDILEQKLNHILL